MRLKDLADQQVITFRTGLVVNDDTGGYYTWRKWQDGPVQAKQKRCKSRRDGTIHSRVYWIQCTGLAHKCVFDPKDDYLGPSPEHPWGIFIRGNCLLEIRGLNEEVPQCQISERCLTSMQNMLSEQFPRTT